MEKKVFKIRRPDGLYSCGGYWEPRWSKSGKAWTSIAALKNHLNLFFHYDSDFKKQVPFCYPYEGCTLETHVVVVSQKDSNLSLNELWIQAQEKKAK
jgi:hypothetical protein